MSTRPNLKVSFRGIFLIGTFILTACAQTVAELPPTAQESPVDTGVQNTPSPEITAVVEATSTASPEPTDQPPEPENIPTEQSIPWPSPRIHPTMFYDPDSGRFLMFSGLTRMGRTVDLNEVWTYDLENNSWEFIGEMDPKDALINFGLDQESGQVVTLNLSPRETWSYDLKTTTWMQQQPSEQPTEENPLTLLFGAPMAYDIESDRLILFGGGVPGMLSLETWAYDFNTDTWEKMQPSSNPSRRAMHALAYDAESDRVILWGGFTNTDENDVRIWAYDYNNDAWESYENLDGPQQHWERGGMVYIPESDRMLLFTGFRELEDELVGPETWYYDFNTNSWFEVATEISPPPMTMYSMAYDHKSNKVIIFGGELTSKYAGNITNDIWIFDVDEQIWSQLAAPTPRQE